MTRQQEQKMQDIFRNLDSISTLSSQPIRQQTRFITRWASEVNSLMRELGNEDAQAKRALDDVFTEMNKYLSEAQSADAKLSARARDTKTKVNSLRRFT